MNQLSAKKKTPPNRICALLIAGSILAALKCIFVGYQKDEGYAVAMAYRMLIGDRMITHIWDPHQTSAFAAEFLMWIYMLLFHTTAGVAIWLRIWGTLIHGALSYGIFRTLRGMISPTHSFYLAILYFNLLPKGYVTPEFSNLLIWFFTLLLLDLSCPDNRKNPFTAFRCGLWMCGMVLAYPSAVLLFPFFAWYLWRQGAHGKRNALFFAGTCLVCGALYLACLLRYMSLAELSDNLRYMLIGNSGHTEIPVSEKLAAYAVQCALALLISAGFLIIAWFILKIRRLSTESKTEYGVLLTYFTLMAAAFFPAAYMLLFPKNDDFFFVFSIYFTLFGFGFFSAFKLEKTERRPLILWLAGSVLAFLAVLLLTDLTIFTSIRYILPGVIMGLAAILMYSQKSAPDIHRRYAAALLLIWCFSSIFVKGWEYRGDKYLTQNITRVRGIISEGPAKGILSEYMQCIIHETFYEEMHEYVKPGDAVFLLEDDTTGYLFQDVTIGSYTTISDPRYNDILLKYWELYPEKYPDVIVVPCWFGELRWNPESWIIQWIENEYGAEQVIDGKYYRYYIL